MNFSTEQIENASAGKRWGPRVAGADRARPLSYYHIRPDGKAKYWIGGGLIEVKKPKIKTRNDDVNWKRGKIKTFSWASRRRLLYKLAMIRKAELPCFLTLTFPNDYPQLKEAKRLFKIMLQRMIRHYPSMSGVWKLEPQERGAAHFHCLVWGISRLEVRWIAENWFEIAGQGDKNHLLFHLGLLPRSKPCIDNVRSWRGVMSYASKYLGKVIDNLQSDGASGGWDLPGRWWGVIQSEKIPWADLEEIAITNRDACRLLRLIRKLIGAKSRNYRSLKAFVEDPLWWRDRLPAMTNY